MKGIAILALLAGLGYAGYRLHAVGPVGEALRAYEAHASAMSLAGGKKLEAIEYELESHRELPDGRIELVVLQTVTWRYQQEGPSRPEHDRSRHTAVMEPQGDSWRVVERDVQDLG